MILLDVFFVSSYLLDSKQNLKCIIRYNIVCCRKYIGQIYTDSLVRDEKALKLLVDTIGQVNSSVTFGDDLFNTLWNLCKQKLTRRVLRMDYVTLFAIVCLCINWILKMTVQVCYFRLYFIGMETVSCRLFLRTARMYVDWNLVLMLPA